MALDPMTLLIFERYVNSPDYQALHDPAPLPECLAPSRQDAPRLIIESTAQGNDSFYDTVMRPEFTAGGTPWSTIFTPWYTSAP